MTAFEVLGSFPSDRLLDLITENDLLHDRITVQEIRARHHETYRAKMKEGIIGAIRAKIFLMERSGASRITLSQDGKFIDSFAFKFLAALEIGHHHRQKVLERLYEELKPVAIHGLVVGEKFLFSMERGEYVIRPRLPHALVAMTIGEQSVAA
ncbi:MAG: hypothetical protein HYV45_03425 [Candidatus Moranbacteria bacterium]|nr:hypothetical protein [Candidatus Moranbacteria bacterium]